MQTGIDRDVPYKFHVTYRAYAKHIAYKINGKGGDTKQKSSSTIPWGSKIRSIHGIIGGEHVTCQPDNEGISDKTPILSVIMKGTSKRTGKDKKKTVHSCSYGYSTPIPITITVHVKSGERVSDYTLDVKYDSIEGAGNVKLSGKQTSSFLSSIPVDSSITELKAYVTENGTHSGYVQCTLASKEEPDPAKMKVIVTRNSCTYQ